MNYKHCESLQREVEAAEALINKNNNCVGDFYETYFGTRSIESLSSDPEEIQISVNVPFYLLHSARLLSNVSAVHRHTVAGVMPVQSSCRRCYSTSS